MKYTSIIFDMDGTIIETEHIWKLASRELIARRGIVLPDEAWSELDTLTHGISLSSDCQLFKDVCKLPDPLENLIKEKELLAHSMYGQGVRFVPGFIDFYNRLSKTKIDTAVATNATPSIVEIVNEKLNLKKLFGNHLYDIACVNYKGKPNPDIFLYAADKLRTDPTACIVIEDSPNGIHAAKSAGMYCIAINTSQQKQKLQEADQIIEQYNDIDLMKLLKGIS